jgi:hypothetical protein
MIRNFPPDLEVGWTEAQARQAPEEMEKILQTWREIEGERE